MAHGNLVQQRDDKFFLLSPRKYQIDTPREDVGFTRNVLEGKFLVTNRFVKPKQLRRHVLVSRSHA